MTNLTSMDEALRWVEDAVRAKTALSVGLVGNAAETIPALVKRGVIVGTELKDNRAKLREGMRRQKRWEELLEKL